MRRIVYARLIAAVVGLLGVSSNAHAQAGAAKKPAETPIVLRISKQLIEELTDDEIEVELPVVDRVGNIPIRGTVKTRSMVTVDIQTSKKTANCVLTADGKAHAFLTANAGPVTAHGQAWIPYRLETRITFDGVKFRAHPVKATLEVASRIDEICTRRNGPVARCVRRIAGRMIGNSKSELDAYLYRRAKSKFEVELAEVAKELVDELNATNRLDEMIAEHFPESKSWNYHVSSTDKIILAAVGPKDAMIPKLRTDADGSMKASMDLWVRTTWEERLVINAALVWNSTHNLLKEVLPDDVAESLAKDVKLTTEGNWFVVRIGRGAIEKALEEAEKE